MAATCFPSHGGGGCVQRPLLHSAMSRRPQQPPIETTQADVEEEEAISGAEEGDEVMEDAQDQEDGYSACNLSPGDHYRLQRRSCAPPCL